MIFMVILVALLIERFFDWSHLRHWDWYANFQSFVFERVGEKSPYFVLALTIIPLLAAVIFFEYILSNTLFGFVEFIFQLVVLLYCLGPQNLWADTFACVNAIQQADSQTAEEKLQASFGTLPLSSGQSLNTRLVSQIFIAANNRIFASVFWFIVLGPIGAVWYRLITLSSAAYPNQKTIPQLVSSARTVESFLDWVPVRLFACVLALGGHCVQVLSCWRKKAGLSLHQNEVLLTECGAAALGREDMNQLTDNESITQHAINLLDRSLVITVFAIAILVLIV